MRNHEPLITVLSGMSTQSAKAEYLTIARRPQLLHLSLDELREWIFHDAEIPNENRSVLSSFAVVSFD